MEYLVPGIMAALAVIMAAVSVKWALFIRSARVSARHLPALGGGGAAEARIRGCPSSCRRVTRRTISASASGPS
ncbi:hypothetical protein IBTHAUMO2_790002 [Nitrosopumilaceae archaeon]|nr:hypothetical protein IBTHAUMO2_790002 [Nitrosopumilaceae archaeon]